LPPAGASMLESVARFAVEVDDSQLTFEAMAA
jgi:hypothetical protein